MKEIIRNLLARSTGEILVFMVAGTVCFTVLATGAAVTFSELIRPEVDTSEAVATITRIILTLITLLAGFLAGRTDVAQQQQQARAVRQDERDTHQDELRDQWEGERREQRDYDRAREREP